MMNQDNIIKIIYYLASTAILIALFIFLLPLALFILATLVISGIILSLVIRYNLKKKNIKMNFSYNNYQRQDQDKPKKMKDVTHSLEE